MFAIGTFCGHHQFHTDIILNTFQAEWWQVDLQSPISLQKVIIYNRGDCCKDRLSDTTVFLFDWNDIVVGTFRIEDASNKDKIEIDHSSFSSPNVLYSGLDSSYKGTSIDGFIQNNNASTKHCYVMNSAFSASFDSFAKEVVVDDPSDEDQCRKVREALGFDRDYPFDVEVSENYHEHQCDPFFSGVDHVSGNDMEALTVSVCHLLCLYR